MCNPMHRPVVTGENWGQPGTWRAHNRTRGEVAVLFRGLSLQKSKERANCADSLGRTLLHYVSWYCYSRAVVMDLVRLYSADIKVRDRYGFTPLHSAAWNETEGGPDMILALVACGADVNAPDRGGWGPLTAAATKGLTGNVKALLRLGADRGMVDLHGHTAQYWAEKEGHTDVVALLGNFAFAPGADIRHVLKDVRCRYEASLAMLMIARRCGRMDQDTTAAVVADNLGTLALFPEDILFKIAGLVTSSAVASRVATPPIVPRQVLSRVPMHRRLPAHLAGADEETAVASCGGV